MISCYVIKRDPDQIIYTSDDCIDGLVQDCSNLIANALELL